MRASVCEEVREVVEAACRAALMHEFVRELLEGDVRERRISVEWRQRLAISIARVEESECFDPRYVFLFHIHGHY
jgi:ABC-type multidrug transport system fused ATPase/permease subunit